MIVITKVDKGFMVRSDEGKWLRWKLKEIEGSKFILLIEPSPEDFEEIE